jgi:hypothetical protein
VAAIDLTPQVLDITAYGGDTLSLLVSFPPGYVAGRIWSAQIRSVKTDLNTDAVFQVNLGATANDPVTLVLSSAATRALVTEAAEAQMMAATTRSAPTRRAVAPFAVGDPITTYSGSWDCQLAPVGGGDPTTTVVRGSIKIVLDVTRLP